MNFLSKTIAQVLQRGMLQGACRPAAPGRGAVAGAAAAGLVWTRRLFRFAGRLYETKGKPCWSFSQEREIGSVRSQDRMTRHRSAIKRKEESPVDLCLLPNLL